MSPFDHHLAGPGTYIQEHRLPTAIMPSVKYSSIFRDKDNVPVGAVKDHQLL